MSEQIHSSPEVLSLEQSEAYIRGLAVAAAETDIQNGDFRVKLTETSRAISKKRGWDKHPRNSYTQDFDVAIYAPQLWDREYQLTTDGPYSPNGTANYHVRVKNKPERHSFGMTTYTRYVGIETSAGYGFTRHQTGDYMEPVAQSYRLPTPDDYADTVKAYAPDGEQSELLFRSIISEIKAVVDASLVDQPETLAAINQKVEAQSRRSVFAKVLGKLGAGRTKS